MNTQDQVIAAIRARYAECQSAIEPKLLKRTGATEGDRKVIYAQNALRPAIEAAMVSMTPMGPMDVVNFAMRLASYCISALPMEAQDWGVATLLQALPQAHEHRVATGVRLSSSWSSDRVANERNFPEDEA